MRPKYNILVFVITLTICVLAHNFTVGYGVRLKAVRVSQPSSSLQYSQSSTEVIYRRTFDGKEDFIHLKIDTTYRAIGKNNYTREIVCDRRYSLRNFDGREYGNCTDDVSRLFVTGKKQSTMWKDTGDNKRIFAQDCRCATAEFGGRKWSVWYSNKLPYRHPNTRPSDGLEGLILDVSSAETGGYTLTAVKLQETI